MKALKILAVGLMGFAACKNAPKADKAVATTAQKVQDTTARNEKYKVDVNNSVIEWIGTKPIGHHHGTVKIKEGYLGIANGRPIGGRFVMDVNSITPDDQDEKGNTKLQTHLKSGDFFDAAKYPDAEFEITSVSANISDDDKLIMKDATHVVTGNLKLKEVSKSITFPAKISMQGSQVLADAGFNIDRTQWGLNYHNDKSLGNKFINPIVNIKLHVQASK